VLASSFKKSQSGLLSGHALITALISFGATSPSRSRSICWNMLEHHILSRSAVRIAAPAGVSFELGCAPILEASESGSDGFVKEGRGEGPPVRRTLSSAVYSNLRPNQVPVFTEGLYVIHARERRGRNCYSKMLSRYRNIVIFSQCFCSVQKGIVSEQVRTTSGVRVEVGQRPQQRLSPSKDNTANKGTLLRLILN